MEKGCRQRLKFKRQLSSLIKYHSKKDPISIDGFKSVIFIFRRVQKTIYI